jgi:hypothetical protein
MSYINITNLKFLNPTGKITEPFKLEVSFDSLKEIKKKVEFKFIYIVDSDEEKDQILDKIELEELNYGAMMFEWEVQKPDYSKLDDPFIIFDTNVVMVVALFDGKEFFRCSYLLRHQYLEGFHEDEEIDYVDWDNLERVVNIEKPIIKMSDIKWE